MEIQNKVLELVEHGYECEYLDFKAKMYSKKGAIDLLRDILAMANSRYQESKYIILGVKDDILNGRSIIGIDPEDKVDPSTYQQYVLSNIEPNINLDLHYINVMEKTLAVIEIKNTNNRPYMLKKNVGNLHEGCCLIRTGSLNSFAKRSDFDDFYRLKSGHFKVIILGNTLRAIDDKNGTAYLNVSLRNQTNLPVTIIGGKLLVKDGEVTLSQHGVFGLNQETGADFCLKIQPFSEETGDLFLGFSSSDCIRLGLNEYGVTDKVFNFELILYDTLNNYYHTKIDNCCVYSKGQFLWKVRLKQKNH